MAATEDKETILLQRLNNVRKKHLSKPVRYEKVQTEFETLGRKASSFTTLQKKILYFLRDFLKIVDRTTLWPAVQTSGRSRKRDPEELRDIATQFLSDMGHTWVQAAETAVPMELPQAIRDAVGGQLSGADDVIDEKTQILEHFSALFVPAINYFERVAQIQASRVAQLELVTPDFSRRLRPQLDEWENQQTAAFHVAGPVLRTRIDRYWDALTSDHANKVSKAIKARGEDLGIPPTDEDDDDNNSAQAMERMYNLTRTLVRIDLEYDLADPSSSSSPATTAAQPKAKGKGRGKGKKGVPSQDVNASDSYSLTATLQPHGGDDPPSPEPVTPTPAETVVDEDLAPEVALVPGLAYPPKEKNKDHPTTIGVGVLLDTGSARSYVVKDVSKAAGFRPTGRTRTLPVTTAFGERQRVKAVEVLGTLRLISKDGAATRLMSLRLWSVPQLSSEIIIGLKDLRKLGLQPGGKGVRVEGVHTEVYLPYASLNWGDEEVSELHPTSPAREEATAASLAEDQAEGTGVGPEPAINGGPIEEHEVHFGEDVTAEQRRRFLDFANSDLAVWRGTTPMRHTTLLEVHLEVKPEARPSFRPTYAPSKTTEERLKAEILKQERQGVVERTKGAGLYASPVFLILKDDGSYRTLFDARNINRLTRPPPKTTGKTMVRVAQSVGKHRYYAVLDVSSAFFSLKVAQDSKHLLQFVLPDKSTWRMARMPMGLSQSPGLWQQALSMALGAELMEQVLAYMDDIAAGAETIDELLDIIERVVRALSAAGFTLSLKKCRIGFRKVRFVGLEISEEGVSLPRDRKEALLALQAPRNKDELRTFIGVVGFYEPAVRGVAAAKAALLELTLDAHRFRWGEEEQQAFDHIVRTIADQAFVTYPDWDNASFTVATDASKVAIGAVLGQHTGERHSTGLFENMAIERPVACASHKLAGAEAAWTTFHKELYTVYWALTKFHWAVHGRTVDVYCDNEAVVRLVQAKEDEEKICLDLDLRINEYERRWLYEISTYDIRMHHRPGKLNTVADYLSRRPGSLANDMAGNDAPWNEKTVERRDARLSAKRAEKRTAPEMAEPRGGNLRPSTTQIQAEARNALAYEAAVWGDQDLGGTVAAVAEGTPGRRGRRRGPQASLDVDPETARAIQEALGISRARDWTQELQDQGEILRGTDRGNPAGAAEPQPPPEEDTGKTITEGIPAAELQAMYNLHVLYGHCGSKQLAALAEEGSGAQQVGQPPTWTSRIRTARAVAQGCKACLERKPGITRPAPGPALAADAVRADHTWHLDLAGPFKMVDGEYYILVTKDALSKHITVRPLNMTTAADTRLALRSIMAERGVPTRVHADRAGNFASEEAKAWLHSMGVETTYSAAGNPRGNGGAERGVRTIKELLRLMGYDLDPSDTPFGVWMERLYQGVWAYNARPSDATGVSPNEVLYARSRDGRADPTGRSRAERAAKDRRRDRKTAERPDGARFAKGDEVWRKLQTPKGGALTKTFYQGPYRVVSVLEREGTAINTYRVQKIGSRSKQVLNGRDLKAGHSLELDRRLSELEVPNPGQPESSSDEEFVLGIIKARGRMSEREYLVRFGSGEQAWLPAPQVSPAAIQAYASTPGTVAIPRTL